MMTFPFKSSRQPTTIITGCYLYDREQDRVVWGDLWTVGDSYVFNACMNDGESAWKLDDRAAADRTLSVNMAQCFERRGVIVIPPSADPVLNYAANSYLKGPTPS